MKYKILLFDIDETLLDFKASENTAFKKLLEIKNYPYSESFFKTYSQINSALWRDLEEGKITLNKVLNTRFTKTLAAYGENVDGSEWEAIYRERLNEVAVPIANALSVCEKLSQNHRLFIITNGLEITQSKRLQKAGLLKYFEDYFYSSVIGHQKPSKEFFDYVKCHINDFNISDALVIGDAINTDIKGGYNAGIDTCWVRFNEDEEGGSITPTYVIKNLNELYKIV